MATKRKATAARPAAETNTDPRKWLESMRDRPRYECGGESRELACKAISAMDAGDEAQAMRLLAECIAMDSDREIAKVTQDRQIATRELNEMREWLSARPASVPRIPPANPEAAAIPRTPMTAEEKTILESIANENGMTVTQEALAGQSGLSDRTVRKWLADLRKRGLVDQPRGPKKGYGITAAGLNAIGRK